ncbi:hypothetical protein SHVI106290_09580 [Shewanella violacea]
MTPNLALNLNLPGVFKVIDEVINEVVDDVESDIKRKCTRSFLSANG